MESLVMGDDCLYDMFLYGCWNERFLVRMLIPSQEVPGKDVWETLP